MSLIDNKRRAYVRPQAAKNYLSIDKVLIDAEDSYKREKITLQPLNQLKPPAGFNHYAESTEVNNPAAEVICSGNMVMVGGNPAGDANGGNRIGILTQDAAPGELVDVIVEGWVYLPIDTEDVLGWGAVPRTGLNGKIASWGVTDGLVSDGTPGVGEGFTIGVFGEIVEAKPVVNMNGYWYASVYLDQSVMLSNTALDPDTTTVTAGSHTSTVWAIVEKPGFVGLTQTFEVQAYANNPDEPVKPQDISWTIDGTTYSNVGFKVTHTFASAGTLKAISVTVDTPSAASVTKNYTATLSATAAISAWAAV